jgi:hypothetical protein
MCQYFFLLVDVEIGVNASLEWKHSRKFKRHKLRGAKVVCEMNVLKRYEVNENRA